MSSMVIYYDTVVWQKKMYVSEVLNIERLQKTISNN